MTYRMAARAALALSVAVLLAGCAAQPPLFRQLKEQKAERITLVVESNPFAYAPPESADTMAGGAPAIALVGALVAVALQAQLDSVNATLAKAAAERGVRNDHRQAFNAEVVRQFRAQGIEVDIVPAPFAVRTLGGDRIHARPDDKDLEALPKDVPAFWLRTDFGSCTIRVIVPCIRYVLTSVNDGGAGGMPRYRGAVGKEPRPNRPKEEAVRSFETLEAATARIEDFDASFPPLIPRAVLGLVEALEREAGRRPAGT